MLSTLEDVRLYICTSCMLAIAGEWTGLRGPARAERWEGVECVICCRHAGRWRLDPAAQGQVLPYGSRWEGPRLPSRYEIQLFGEIILQFGSVNSMDFDSTTIFMYFLMFSAAYSNSYVGFGHFREPSFKAEFVELIVKMGQIGVKTGFEGEIRLLCSRFN